MSAAEAERASLGILLLTITAIDARPGAADCRNSSHLRIDPYRGDMSVNRPPVSLLTAYYRTVTAVTGPSASRHLARSLAEREATKRDTDVFESGRRTDVGSMPARIAANTPTASQ